MRLLVNLLGVDPCGQDEGGVHLPAAARRKEMPREIKQRIHKQHDCVLVAVAVSTLCGMEEGMGIADLRVGIPDDPPQHVGRGMRRKADDQLPHEAFPPLHVIERLKAIRLDKQLVDKGAAAHEVVGGVVREQDVLHLELHHLLVATQRCAGVVGVVPQPAQLCHARVDLPGYDVRQRHIRGIKSERAVLKDVDRVTCAQDRLVDGLGNLFRRHHADNAFDFLWKRYGKPLARGLQLSLDIDVLVHVRRRPGTTFGALLRDMVYHGVRSALAAAVAALAVDHGGLAAVGA